MTLNEFIELLHSQPKQIKFEDTMGVIDDLYAFKETSFSNGEAINAAGENSGSCKLFSFASLQELTQQQTLFCFGQYYQDVLNQPESDSHQNIRQFMQSGWDQVSFSGKALRLK